MGRMSWTWKAWESETWTVRDAARRVAIFWERDRPRPQWTPVSVREESARQKRSKTF